MVVDLATSWFARFFGVWRCGIPTRGRALWLYPCCSVHTFGLPSAIDIIYFDKQMRPVKYVQGLKPWRVSVCLRACSVLELPAGTLQRARRSCIQ